MTPERMDEIRQDVDLEAEGIEPGYWTDTVHELLDALATCQSELRVMRERAEAAEKREQELASAGAALFRAAEGVDQAITEMVDSGPEWPAGLHKGTFIDLIGEIESYRPLLLAAAPPAPAAACWACQHAPCQCPTFDASAVREAAPAAGSRADAAPAAEGREGRCSD